MPHGLGLSQLHTDWRTVPLHRSYGSHQEGVSPLVGSRSRVFNRPVGHSTPQISERECRISFFSSRRARGGGYVSRVNLLRASVESVSGLSGAGRRRTRRVPNRGFESNALLTFFEPVAPANIPLKKSIASSSYSVSSSTPIVGLRSPDAR